MPGFEVPGAWLKCLVPGSEVSGFDSLGCLVRNLRFEVCGSTGKLYFFRALRAQEPMTHPNPRFQ